jgi:hypothetical protein
MAPPPGRDFQYIDTSFENASPVWYERAPDGAILVYLLYDHERSFRIERRGIFIFRCMRRRDRALRWSFGIWITCGMERRVR